MCGIAGFVGVGTGAEINRMSDALFHRGPDAAGHYHADNVWLGHRRLAIVDLVHGQQPFANEDGSIVVTFNGEIYNFRQLRQTLEPLGHRFVSDCDTEVIVHAYETWGLECIQHLHGMFAFVLLDRNRQLLFGVRDRLGKKPLYYTARPLHQDVEFAFASEIKALRAHPALQSAFSPNRRAVTNYLLHDYTLGSETIFNDIQRLEAGSAFVYYLNDTNTEGRPRSPTSGPRVWRYWSPTFVHGNQDPETTGQHASTKVVEATAGARVLELLTAAVQRRLMADVPLGVLLSGGLDSSLIVALMTRLLPAREIQTFSIGFEEASFDESSYAALVAQHFGTSHHTRRFTANDLLARLPAVAKHLDEPFADPSVLPFALLSEFAREKVTVALGGDGGDELFAGYDPFRALEPARWYHHLIPTLLHQSVIAPLACFLPISDRNLPLRFKVERFLRGVKYPPSLWIPLWMGAFSPTTLITIAPGLADLLQPETAYAPVARDRETRTWRDPFLLAQRFYMSFYLTDDILVKVDRASMMHSLEVRSPFLDTALVEYVNRLPKDLKFRHGKGKYLLKKMLMGANGEPSTLPASIIHRQKKGFGIPVSAWLRGPLAEPSREVLLSPWPGSMDWFQPDAIASFLQAHLHRRADHGKELWALFMLRLWAREFLGE